MNRLQIINPRTAGESEVVGIGDDLSIETLLWAYRHGIFPWPITGYPLLWFCPPERAVLDFDKLHVPRRLIRLRRRTPLVFTINRDFPAVIAACREVPRPGQAGTWITDALMTAYIGLHRAGYALSVEAWAADGQLTGGLYGVFVDNVFSGESMFHRAPNTSKLALLHLIDHLQAQGLGWIDIQMMTPHMSVLGAHLISRDEYLDRLS